MQLSTKSDYELIERLKRGKDIRNIKEYFWKKYEPMIKAVVSRYLKIPQTHNDYEDYIQDCYFYFEKALDKVNLKRVKDISKFSFGAYAKYYLRAYTKTDIIRGHKIAISTDEYCEDNFFTLPTGYLSETNIIKEYEAQETKEVLKKAVYEFMISCCKEDQILFDILVEKGTTCEVKTAKEWVKMSSGIKKGHKAYANKKYISRQLFHGRVKKLERRFIDHLRTYGYYSSESLEQHGLEKLI